MKGVFLDVQMRAGCQEKQGVSGGEGGMGGSCGGKRSRQGKDG